MAEDPVLPSGALTLSQVTADLSEHMNGTERLCSSPSSCKGEDGWPEAVSFATLNNAGDAYPSESTAEACLSDSECSDVDLDNDWVEGEDLGSDSSIDSIENRKENKWLRPFFHMLKNLSLDPTAENTQQDTLFYCPACRGSGLGEVSVYKGFKPLIAHAKQYQKRRVKLHRDFAATLEEDLKRRGMVTEEPRRVNPFCNQISSMIKDENLLIVWPPTIVIQTLGIKAEGHHKRIGLKNREILEMFKDYHPKKVTQAYVHDEDNNCFLSLLVFRDSPVGYMHAKRLAKNFKRSKRGRSNWDDLEALKLQPCSDGMLYGYMAEEEDMLMFNTHDARQKKVNWDLKRYQDVVIEPLILMQEAKLENNWLKAKLQEQEEHSKELEKVLSKLFAKQELEAEEFDFANQIARKHSEAKAQEMETNSDAGGDSW